MFVCSSKVNEWGPLSQPGQEEGIQGFKETKSRVAIREVDPTNDKYQVVVKGLKRSGCDRRVDNQNAERSTF